MPENLIELQQRLSEIEEEREQLIAKINFLKAKENTALQKNHEFLGVPAGNCVPHKSEEKIALFLKLFRCRENVYPKLWENQSKNIKGYSPACKNEWVNGICRKREKIKCSECPNKSFLCLDEIAVKLHLLGHHTIGTYAIRQDDTCSFLACDFDGDGWKADVLAYQKAANELHIESAVEISRSGNGAHAWIFFSQYIQAKSARQLGTLIISKAIESRPIMGLTSYDRFFPNQDFIPKGGFGNLIALPLQKTPRDNGRSVFVDNTLHPYQNQWEYLAGIRRISYENITETLEKYLPQLPIHHQPLTEDDDFQLIVDEKITEIHIAEQENIRCDNNVQITLGSQISIQLNGLPSKIIAKLKRMATLANPEFYKRNRMRMSTYGFKRLIFCGEIQNEQIVLPIGLKEDVLSLFKKIKAKVIVYDKRPILSDFDLKFKGELTNLQTKAIEKIKNYETGIIVAPPGSGKTVMACFLIAERKKPTLVIVHRQPLLTQWMNRLSEFLNIDSERIGIISGTKRKAGGVVDIAMMQTLASVANMEEELPHYGQIIIDECHHIPCVTFEDILKRIPAQFIIGLTATPYRKDRLEKIIHFYCGPICSEITTKEQSTLSKKLFIKETNLKLPETLGTHPPIHLVWQYLILNEERNIMIVDDILECITNGRKSLVISDRTEHLNILENKLRAKIDNDSAKIFRIKSDDGKKKRTTIISEINEAVACNIPFCLLATSTLIGEGFDLPALDTLFLAMPLSFKGRMIQYAGRLHRESEHKKEVVIYDYWDINLPLTIKMFRNRQKTYKSMGYTVANNNGILFR